MRKRFIAVIALLMVGLFAAGCLNQADFRTDSEIAIVSREDGSGTRGAFVELTGIERKTSDGTKDDRTTIEAMIANSTNFVMTSVAQNPSAIGYISLGSINETVKALRIDGVEISVGRISDGDYRIARPFIIAYQGELSAVAQDFLTFILSATGRSVIAEAKYVPVSTGDYAVSTDIAGKIVIGGSSSVTPIMEKLKEAYLTLNPRVEIEIQQSDSTTGLLNVTEGIVDFGMVSRELKESERAALTPVVIARDGIAVIVNNANPTDSIALETVEAIFTGQILNWDDVDSEKE